MACSTKCQGCSNALFVGDWLEGVLPSQGAPPLVEVRFKGHRRDFFWSKLTPPLTTGEWVVVPEIIRRTSDAPPQTGKGYDVGQVSLTGYLAEGRLKGARREVPTDIRVLRRATPEDRERWLQARKTEPNLLKHVRQLVKALGLAANHDMKVTDVELTASGTTLICYFTAKERVDFRELIRRIGDELKVRPEMRQIAEREETAQLGGIGPCGRELCCSTWMTQFPPVPSEAARYQGLSLNSTKITGLCGKLKCCLNYELDTYKEITQRIPKIKTLRTAEGEWRYLRTELLLERLWFEKVDEGKQVCLSASAARELAQKNDAGEIPPSIEPYCIKFPDVPTRI
ncbi:MAG: hypothetical protein D6750_07075 [Bacteroidetes bacterium]|nr:MAG: hypothetical protein D6750_07075 [Bacteroidota bacterium]